jgi:hypothetical protein
MSGMPEQNDCPCLQGDVYHQSFEGKSLGMDDDYGEVSIKRCKRCGRYWLHYLMEYEYLTRAGRWFRGLITPEMAASVTTATAKSTLESLDWYFRGGSAFGGKVIRTNSGQLKYWLMPFPGPE